MSPDPKSYILSDAESRAIFEEEIVPTEFGETAGQRGVSANTDGTAAAAARQPLAVFIIGQTGAGKTRIAPVLRAAMKTARDRGPGRGREPVHFIADTYKAYHPAYAQLAAERPGLASPATGPDARRWLAMAAERAAELRLDVLLESACRHAADFTSLARTLAQSPHGAYRVEVVILAAPRALSLLGVLARFYLHGRSSPEERGGEGLVEGPARVLPARLTPRTVHDESYAGVLEAATFIDKSGSQPDPASEMSTDTTATVVDQVVVVRRDTLVAYVDERGPDGRWTRSRPGSTERGGVAAALEAERRRPLTVSERAAADADLQRLRYLEDPGLEAQLVKIDDMIRNGPIISGSGERDRPQPGFSTLEFAALNPFKSEHGSDSGSVGFFLRFGT